MDKVAIVVPSGDRVHANFAISLAFMTHVTRQVQLVLINPKGSNVAKQRHSAVVAAAGAGCTWMLMLDSDLTFPHDILTRLLKRGKHIVGAGYARRVPPHNNLIVRLPDAQPQGGLLEVAALPTGAMLIHLSVFKDLSAPFFRWGCLEADEELHGLDGVYRGPDLPGEDYIFCVRARAAGFSIYADLDLTSQLIHWGEQGTRIMDATQPGSFELVEME